jgi:hypothetical protein
MTPPNQEPVCLSADASSAGTDRTLAILELLGRYHYPVAALTVIGPSFRVTESRFSDIGLQCITAAAEARARLLE